MPHLDEFLLNEYVDNALDQNQWQAVETHLADCTHCRETLAELQMVLATLDEVVDVALTADLSARVVAQIEPQTEPAFYWTRPLLLAQIAAAMGMFIWLWPVLQSWLVRTGQTVTAAIERIQWPQLSLWGQIMAWGTAVLETPPAPTFNLAGGQWGLLLGLALAAWLMSSRLLFTTNMNGESHG